MNDKLDPGLLYVRETIESEASIEAALVHYSDFKDIDNADFHRLRDLYIDVRNKICEMLALDPEQV